MSGMPVSEKSWRGVHEKLHLLFTNHARVRMGERGITEDDVRQALLDPVQIVYDRAKDVYLILGSNNVAIVLSFRAPLIEVVTVLRRREYEALVQRLSRRRYRIVL